MPRATRKVFVLDTNVILHDSACLHHFAEHDVVVPMLVLEELDRFKKGNDSLNFHAREFLRALDALSGDTLFTGGVRIGPDLGRVNLRLEGPIHPDLAATFSTAKADHRILNTAYQIAQERPRREVILVSKDVNLRMKAKAVGLMAQDYKNDQVRDLSVLYSGTRLVTEVNPDLIDGLYREPHSVEPALLGLDQALLPNEFLILRNGRKSALATYDATAAVVRHVGKSSAYTIVPRNAEQAFALYALLTDAVQLVTLTGKAGTGKTLLALAAALERRRVYRQIYMARPVVPLSNKDLGFLPGDVDSKLAPYMQPLHDNLGVIRDQCVNAQSKHRRIDAFLEEGKLVIAPLAYIRGRSLVRIFFIVDEAQNLTPHEVKTIITRAGEGTKIVLTGDIDQIDHPYLDSRSNGLSHLIEKMKGQPIHAHVNLERGERSPLADLGAALL